MNILNIKNWTIFLFAGFVVVLILVGSQTTVTAQTRIENAMKELGCNTMKSCDIFCDLPENNSSGKCSAYFVFRENLTALEEVMTLLDYCTTLWECNTYCETNANLHCRTYYGLRNDTAGLGKLYDRLRQGDFLRDGDVPGGCSGVSSTCRQFNDEAARWTLSIKNAIENNKVSLKPYSLADFIEITTEGNNLRDMENYTEEIRKDLRNKLLLQ